MAFWQALLIAAIGYCSSIYSPWLIGGLGGWYTLGRPLVSGLIIGIILGNIPQGIILGAAIQALYIGLVTPGGSMPADVNFAAWVGIPLAMVSSASSEQAVALSIPLSMLGVAVVYLTVTINCLFVHKQDAYIDAGELEKAERIPVIGQVTNFVFRFFPLLLINYIGQGFITWVVQNIPAWLGECLNLFGSMLPLVGFALLLRYVVKNKIILVYYVIGFVLISVFKISIIPVAIIGIFLAYLDFRYAKMAEEEQPDEADPMAAETGERKRLLNRKDVFKAYREWMFWNLSAQNMERMQGPAIIRMMGAVKEKLYPGDREAQKELLARHTPFFNTEPYVGSIAPGVALGMEEERAAGSDVPDEVITGVKTALMGPFAGIGDSLMPGTYIPILLSIGLGISATTGSVGGPLFYIIVYLGTMLPLTWWLFSRGYKMGINAAENVLGGNVKDRLTNAISIIGLVVVGAISAQYVNIKTGLVFTSGQLSININDMLNGLFPQMLTLIFAFITYWLLANKKWGVGKIFLLYLIVAVIGYFTHILAL